MDPSLLRTNRRHSNTETQTTQYNNDPRGLSGRRSFKRKRTNNAENDIPAATETEILPTVCPCVHCGATRFYGESPSFCCMSGTVSIQIPRMNPDLWKLYTDQSCELAKRYRNRCRSYNNSFAFTSLGMEYDKPLSQYNMGVYTLKVHGIIRHYVEDLVPGKYPAKCMQLYFYGTEDEVENRLQTKPSLQADIIKILMKIMECNPYERFFRSLIEKENLEERIIVLRADPNVDKNVYNLPQTDHVAAIWKQNKDASTQSIRDIRVYTKSGRIHSVNYYYGCFDPLQYPLLFPYGEPGWQQGIRRLDPGGSRGTKGERIYCVRKYNTSTNDYDTGDAFLQNEQENIERNSKAKKDVSVREYYCYLFQLRNSDTMNILRTGRVIQQFIIDVYIKVETQRLDYIRKNQQKEIRIETLKGIKDSIAGESNFTTEEIGKRIYLPSSFPGSKRDLHCKYMNALALAQKFDKPSFFVTMTCNSKWKEIQDQLLPGEEAQNRPDLLVRVFHAKNKRLKEELIDKGVLGPVAAYFYVIEFQKRGLPHAHWLLILDNQHRLTSPEDYDKFVRAEIPDKETEPHLYDCVTKHMMHGPCGDLNVKNVCMKEGKDKKKRYKNKYPKQFSDSTMHNPDSYPIYRRREDGRSVYTRRHNLDNRWVIPYNPYLLAKFDCHINVEICSDIKLVKYLYKYVCKGKDKIKYTLIQQEEYEKIDEIKEYQDARWICAPESMWRLYSFRMNDMYPSVEELQVHIEDYQKVCLRRGIPVEDVLKNPKALNTQLTQFFEINRTDEEARNKNLLYREFPTEYWWDTQSKEWLKRTNKRRAIGRMVAVNPIEEERYYLRVLLNHIRAPQSFKHLRTVDNVVYSTFLEAARARGLLKSDGDIKETLQEACGYKMPYALRDLFATILYYNSPTDPQALWHEFKEEMSGDFLRDIQLTEEQAYERSLKSIDVFLQNYGRSISNYKIIDPTINTSQTHTESRHYMNESWIKVSESYLSSVKHLNSCQKKAFDEITTSINNKNGGVFFLDGPGGTGKTFLYRALLASVRSKNNIALVVATSGVAESLLPGGRTAHNRFGFPFDLEETVSSSISKQSEEARLIVDAQLILWDEATMAHRKLAEGLDNLLRDFTGKDILFGGKTVVFGGDFRQTVPVVKHGGKSETIDACLIKSYLWQYMRKLSLTQNMRAREDPYFIDYLMRIGDGIEDTDRCNKITIPEHMCIKYAGHQNPLQHLISEIYPSLDAFATDPYSVIDRAVLTPRNDCVDEINEALLDDFPGHLYEYYSSDIAQDDAQQATYQDFLNQTHIPGLPQHHLRLKLNCPIMMMRNLNAAEGMCNGTRMIVKDLGKRIIGATIVSGDQRGKYVMIPRISLEAKDNAKCPVPFKRLQFPIRLCFAMTINKAQGQTLDKVGVYLPSPVFSHGQLYVALSRARSSSSVKVLIKPQTAESDEHNKTKNMVYHEILDPRMEAQVKS